MRGIIFALVLVFFLTGALPAHAAITEEAQPIDAIFASTTIGGGAIIPLAQFRLTQTSGTDTLTKVGVQIVASSTMTQGEISRISLWQESGTSPGFQPTYDTFIAGAASTTPLVDSTLIVLATTTGVTINAQGSQFYIVASTTAVSGITNSHAFNIQMQTNYASTSAGTGVGTAFASNKKVILNQSGTLKISEVKAGSSGNASDEFVELYNSGEAAINLSDMPLALHAFYTTGSSSPVSLTYYNKIIPSYGYFLITNPIGYGSSVSTDATFSTSTFSVLFADGGLSIATSSSGTAATSTAIDRVGWGEQPTANCENSDTNTEGFYCAPAISDSGSALERLALGYPNATSTAATMFTGGADSTKGNGLDRNDNSAEFVAQSTADPQNSFKPTEFPYGGGQQDNSTLQVMGSFPSNGVTGFPMDISFMGFMFNKPVNSLTIASATATSTVTLYKVASGAPTGSNLCTTVSYNPFPGNFEPQAKCNITSSLEASTSYVLTITDGVRDLSGNRLDQNSFQSGNQYYIATSTTGGAGQTFTNMTPPNIIGTTPFMGAVSIPTNLSKIAVEFNQMAMDTTTFTATNITLLAQNSSTNKITGATFSFATSTGKNVLTVTLAEGTTLTANTSYSLVISASVKTLNSAYLPAAYTARFTTGGGADATAPTVIGVIPSSTGTIPVTTNDFVFIFSKDIDGTTATTGSVTLAAGGANLPGAVRYDPVAKEGHFTASNVLPAGQALVFTIKGASIRSAAGVAMGTNVTRNWTTEASNTDTTGPTILFANADDYSVTITFSEPVNSTDAIALTNYTITVGGTAQTLSSMAGHTLSYDVSTRTAKLQGLRIPSGSTVVVSATGIKDITGNSMSGTSSFTFTSSSSATSGGMMGPGSFSGSTFGEVRDFSGSGIGFMPPVSARTQNSFVNASTTLEVELPIASQIPASGTIVITFPSSSDFGLCCAATTSTRNPYLAEQNRDINGPGDGTIGINTITKNATAKTITLTLSAATRASGSDQHDFLRFVLADIKNPSIPKSFDSSGYVLDIKSKNASGVLLESFNANPLFITGGSLGGGATTTILGTLSGNGGNLEGVTVHLGSPQTGPMDATTDSNGLYTFSDIPVNSSFLTNNFGGGGEYMLFLDPFISATGTSTNFFGSTMPTPVQATSSSRITRDFALTPTTAAVSFTVFLNAAASTFTASEQVDVFAGGPGQFVVRTVTPGAALLANYSLTTIPIPQVNGHWGIGIGPATPKGTGGGFSGPPPATTWSAPRPIEVTVSGCPSACSTAVNGMSTTTNIFTITHADKTIGGVLRDGSGNSISGAMVFAFSPTGGGMGTNAQTSASGAFSLAVTTGSYVVGAFNPGMGQSKELSVVVDSSNNLFVDGSSTASASLTLTMSKPSYTITGRVTDGTSAVGNAPVYAYRSDGPGHADAQSDSSSGNYTMYVDNGTWKVNSFIPGFGPMTEQTVVISGANQTDINFAPSTSQNFSLYSGNIYEDLNSNNIFATSTEGISGAIIRLSGTNGSNEGVSGDQGAFSIRVPSGTGYTITDIFHPTYGRIAPLNNAGTAIGTLNLTASSTNQYIRVPTRNTITVNIKDSSGALVIVPKAFIDLYDTATKQGNRIEITNASSTSIQVATGTTPRIRAFIDGVPPTNVSSASDSTGTTVTSGAVTVDNSTETVKVVVNTSTANLSTISGIVYHTAATPGNELSETWLQFVDETNGVHFGTQATTSGKFSIKASNGTYQVLVSKPGYVGTPATLTVSGDTTLNPVLTSANLTITGTITTAGTAASEVFVRAEKIGGGQAVTRTNTSGAYTLYVSSGNWKVYAAAEGYSETAYTNSATNNTAAAGATGVNINLTTTVSLRSELATSNTFTDTASVSFSDSTVGVKVELDSNALGSSGSNAYLTAKETSNFPNTASVNIVANKGKDINAYSGGSKITTLQSGKTANVELTYTKAELGTYDTVAEVNNLKVVAYSEDKKEWESLSTVPTYYDSSGAVVASPSNLSTVATVAFTAVGSHFSTYALSSPTGSSPPDTPSGLTATPGAGVGSAVALAWSTAATAEGYYIYRSTDNSSFPLLADASGATTASYSDSAVTAGTTYYYKVAAYKSNGSSESAASSAVSATVKSAGGGGSPGGGGGGASYGPPPRAQKVYPDGTRVYLDEPGAAAKIKELDAKFAKQTVAAAAKTVPAETKAQASAVARAVSPVFNKDLARGARNNDVKRLQTLLGVEATGFFGTLTEKALKTFQVKYGVVKNEKSAGAGKLGPATRAKFKELGSGIITPATPAPSSAETAAPSSGTSPAKTALEKQIQDALKQIEELQKQLNALKAL